MSRWATLALVVLGCGHAAPAPPPAVVGTTHATPAVDARPADASLDEDLPRLADRAVELYAQWRRAMEDAQGDCAAATAKVNAVADANADVIAANATILAAGHDRIAALRAALEPHQAELDAAAQAIVQSKTMSACAHDAAFAKAIDRIGGEQ